MSAGGQRSIPTLVIGGYLGSGKTSLVNHLLHAGAGGRRTLVLVNDFGSLAIDEEFVAARDGDVVTLANGCVCCGLVGTLSDTLREVRELATAPELLVIEASGVADPQTVGHHAMVPGFSLDGVVVLADAELVRRRARDSLVGRTIERQLAAADLLVVNKVDLIDPAALPDLLAWVRARSPRASVVTAVDGDVPLALLLGTATHEAAADHDRDDHAQPHARHDEWTWTDDDGAAGTTAEFDPMAFAAWLDDLPDGVVRVKGTVTLAGKGRHLVQRVGHRSTLTPLPSTSGAPNRLVVLGLSGSLDPAVLAAGLAAVRALPTP